MTVTISAFRNNLKDILEKVKKGKVVEITQRGKVIARINPTMKEEEWLKHELDSVRKNSKINGGIIAPVFEGETTMDMDNLYSLTK